MGFTDKNITCVDCNKEFIFSTNEQEFYASKDFAHEPKRCPDCMQARKSSRNGSGGAGYQRQMNIYIGNLAYEVTEADIKQEFEAFGEVTSVSVVKDQYSGQSKGFGFVEMPKLTEGQAAITGLNGKQIKGRAVTVNVARPKGEGGSRGGGGGRGSYGGGSGGRGGSRRY